MPNQHHPQARAWLAARFLENEKQHHFVRSYTLEGAREPNPEEGRFAPIPLAAFHDYLLSIGADVAEVVRECSQAGWIGRADRYSPTGGTDRFYCIYSSVLSPDENDPATQTSYKSKQPSPKSSEGSEDVLQSPLPPLTEPEQRVLDIIKALPPGRGVTGKQIIDTLDDMDFPLDQSTLTTHIIPKLKKWHGIRNRRGGGYYSLPK